MKLPKNARFGTICLHAGQEPDPSTGAIVTPIYQTSTYVQDELGVHKGYEYARTQNPTRFALERNIASIEGGAAGFAFASGMAAIGAIGTMLKAGDHVIVSKNTYGGTFRFFDKVLTRAAVSFSYVDTANMDEIEREVTSTTRMLFVETPTNPIMRLTDLAAAAALAHRRGTGRAGTRGRAATARGARLRGRSGTDRGALRRRRMRGRLGRHRARLATT